MSDGCPVCGTAMQCTCCGRGYPAQSNSIDHEEHYADGSVLIVYEDGSEKWLEVMREVGDE